MSFHVPNNCRVRSGALRTTDRDGNNGAFFIPNIPPRLRPELRCIASDGMGWEHVSVSVLGRCPTWAEMCHIKSIFWDAEDCVLQYHPPQSEYVNNHPSCLHLWRPIDSEVLRPHSMLVGHL